MINSQLEAGAPGLSLRSYFETAVLADIEFEQASSPQLCCCELCGWMAGIQLSGSDPIRTEAFCVRHASCKTFPHDIHAGANKSALSAANVMASALNDRPDAAASNWEFITRRAKRLKCCFQHFETHIYYFS